MNKQLITLSGGAAAVLLFGCTTNNTTINVASTETARQTENVQPQQTGTWY